MPRRAAHHVQWSAEVQRYTIWIDCAHAQEQITPDSRSWFDWLEEIRSFAFSSRAGERCTALKERVQRGDAYWYGYRSLHGRTVKRYLGRTRDLSTTRLEEIAALLADESPSRHQVPRQNQGKALSQSTQAPSTHQGKAEAGIFLLVSKLQPPRLPAPLIDRGELFASLETSLTHALTLIQTPAGFGKTTLVTQWLARNQVRDDFPAVGWVSLDAGDNDVLRFWRYVITACQGKQPSLGENALSSLSASAPSPFVTPSLATVLTLLLNDLAQQEHAGLLVLDDYQVITEPTIHETLTFFLEHLPTTFHVLLLTQAEPPLPLLRWRAGGELGELHYADLRFSPEETATFLCQAVSVPLSDTMLTQLDGALEGWAAGLRLLSLAWQNQQAVRGSEISFHSLPACTDIPLLQRFPGHCSITLLAKFCTRSRSHSSVFSSRRACSRT
ncbi:LuxR family maltose regulon positive regulatory protein [Thermosporothrix hazakensis]|jgi:LuxR family maltose regulon positive regulatory protein|uniref:LuxR family maltose regulon positive regulatory protein n=1 Tax=Thermosporothrix hazakensis TaxID=644383 RepID=A0A326U4X3_THEHA|nr:hypothetical protein [Thermosporothrix hazakensis]PZW20554.1 LuxR family maltose regulon positive regulatory protein [Thermosporothrix hazakensis]